MRGIKRSQLVNMNQHYRRFSMDFFLDCQQRLGIGQIELWCGAAHFWLDHTGYDDVSALRAKLRAHGVRVVSVTAPSIAYQYQYAAQEPAHLEYSFRYFSNAIHLAAELGADRVVIPEQENATRLARSLASPNVLDYIELSHDYGIIEVPTPKGWLGSSLRKLNVRAKLGVNIIAVKRDGKVEVTLDPDRELSDGDVLVVLGDNKALERVQRQ